MAGDDCDGPEGRAEDKQLARHKILQLVTLLT